ncbi:hypothetical protein NC652_032501 [Populus alba x Populus x berolinensis]|nr:hypothetical protein NC652_032501 [Populus alba x Populus x berolinensis]
MATISSQWCMLVIDYHIEAASIARSLTVTTVVFFAYVGFDAVANSAEESRRPQACFVDLASSEAFSNALHFVFGVCLVINGMRRCCRWTYDSPFTTLLNTANCTHQSQLRVPASSCSMDGSANGTAFYDVFV